MPIRYWRFERTFMIAGCWGGVVVAGGCWRNELLVAICCFGTIWEHAAVSLG